MSATRDGVCTRVVLEVVSVGYLPAFTLILSLSCLILALSSPRHDSTSNAPSYVVSHLEVVRHYILLDTIQTTKFNMIYARK